MQKLNESKFPRSRRTQMYPFRVGLALPNEVREKIDYLRSQGVDTGEVMRKAIMDYLADVKVPEKAKSA